MAKVHVGNSSFNVTKNNDDLLLDDELVNYSLIQNPNGSSHLLYKDKSYTIEVLEKEDSSGKLSLKINGRIIHTKLTNKLEELLKTMGMESGKKTIKELKAPMPGLVLKMFVESDEEVIAGQELLILEAMKMENAIKSPQDGIIDSIHVQNTDKVDKNQVLITFK